MIRKILCIAMLLAPTSVLPVAAPAFASNVERRCAQWSGNRADEDLAGGFITQDQWIDRQSELFDSCMKNTPQPHPSEPYQDCVFLDGIYWFCLSKI
jgi:hypothetical protein